MNESQNDAPNKFNVKLLSILSYIGPLFITGKLSVEKENALVKFHSSQGMRLFVFEIIATVMVLFEYFLLSSFATVREVLSLILIIGFSMASFIMMILGIISAVKENFIKLPFIGGRKKEKTS